MQLDRSGLQVLSRQECLALLSTVEIGRIVFTSRALPAVQPVSFLLDGAEIVIKTSDGSRLAAATRQAVVAFQADEFDLRDRTGWSVTVVGRVRTVRDAAELARLDTLPLLSWTPRDRDHYVVVGVEQVTGRRITAAFVGR